MAAAEDAIQGDGQAPAPRIVSLLPSITEIVAALGMGSCLVGRTHECDFPPRVVEGVAVVTSSGISPHSMSQEEIHRAVCGSLAAGHSLYGLDEDVLARVEPTVVLTQAGTRPRPIPSSAQTEIPLQQKPLAIAAQLQQLTCHTMMATLSRHSATSALWRTPRC